jgi:hypothetical protein
MKRLAADTVSALFWLAMRPLYWVVRRALRDELDDEPDPTEPWLAQVEEQIEVWEPYDCRMMRP